MTDARKLNRPALQRKRIEVIRLHQDAVPVMQIVSRTGLSWGTVNTTINRYLAEGESALVPQARGRKTGSGRVLTPEQEVEIRQCMRKRPMQLRLPGLFWNRNLLVQLIKLRTGCEFSARVVGHYLKRWGLVLPHANRPLPAQCTPTVRRWLADQYAAIEQQAQTSGAEILWLFRPLRLESSSWIRSATAADERVGTAKPMKFSGVFAANNQGKQRWIIHKDSFTAKLQIAFLKALLKDIRRKPLILIRTSELVYRNQEVMDWLEARQERIKLYPPKDFQL